MDPDGGIYLMQKTICTGQITQEKIHWSWLQKVIQEA